MKKVLYSWLLTSLCVGVLSAQPIYISPTGTGTGATWSDPINLQSALSTASAGDELWLLGGIYVPTTCADCAFADREIYFQLPDGVALYGGFTGSETSITDRSPSNPPTILSGDIDQDGTIANNSFTILYTEGVTAATVVDGVTLRGGNADFALASADSPFSSGGAWYNRGVLTGNNSSPTLRNCRFENNFALRFGGAFYHHASFGGSGDLIIENCTFLNNICETDGGAIYFEASFGGSATAVITNTTFTNNEAQLGQGGAIVTQGGEDGYVDLTISNSQFVNNTGAINGGAISNYARNGSAGGTYTDCVFDGNTAVFGGGISNDGSIGGVSSPTITDCSFVNSTGGNEGAGVYNIGFQGTASPTFLRCRFANNMTDGSGGAIFNNGVEGESSPTFDQCVFSNNAVVNYGAAMYNFGKGGESNPVITNSLFVGNSGTSGGAVYNLGSEFGQANAIITNCTFVDNMADVGGAIYANGSDETGTSEPIITNCIFDGNEAPTGHIFRAISATITVRYSAFDVSDCAATWSGIEGEVLCADPIFYDADPQFENPAQMDFRLAEGSPLIDAGLNDAAGMGAADLAGNTRIVDGTVDLGAYEYGAATVQPTTFFEQPQSVSGCAGEDFALSVGVTGAAPLTYQWYFNGEVLTGETATQLIIANAQVADIGAYYLAVTNSAGTTEDSDAATLTVFAPMGAGAAITTDQTSICEAEAVTLTAAVISPGDAPLYRWLLNGNPVAVDGLTWTVDSLADGDEVGFELTSNAVCVLDSVVNATPIIFTVVDNLTPAVNLTSSIQDTLCLDSLATFTATAIDAGSMPAYSWLLNGAPTGDTLAAFSTTALQDGDEVSVVVNSSATCTTQPTATSDIQVIAAKTCMTTGVRDLPALAARAQPNPFQDQLSINLPGATSALQLRLVDMQGKVWRDALLASGTATITLDTQGLPAGSYVLTLVGARGAYRQLLIHQ